MNPSSVPSDGGRLDKVYLVLPKDAPGWCYGYSNLYKQAPPEKPCIHHHFFPSIRIFVLASKTAVGSVLQSANPGARKISHDDSKMAPKWSWRAMHVPITMCKACLQILSRPEQHKGRKAETFGHLKALNPVATFPFRQQAGLSYQL